MSLIGHVKDDLDATDESSLLLAHPMGGSFVSDEAVIGTLEGCYLYYHKTNYCWIRSGKVVGPSRNIAVRHEEHRKGSKLSGSQEASKFYMTFPDKDASPSKMTIRKGFFDQLVLYCGMGFSRRSDESSSDCALLSVEPSVGIFTWGADVINGLARSNSRVTNRASQIRLLMKRSSTWLDTCVS